MNVSSFNTENNSGNKKFRPLGRSLLLWFLLLSLLPLTITAWLGYRQMVDGLTQSALNELEHSAQQKADFIKTWFHYREMDVLVQAENKHNIYFLRALNQGLLASRQSADRYIETPQWKRLVKSQEHELVSLSSRYEYIGDLFLVNRKGDILYSVLKEFDLGSNLFNGIYAGTELARIAKISMDTKQVKFSDFNRHGTETYLLVGFLSAPMVDANGKVIGVFLLQMRLKRLAELMRGKRRNTTQIHYLVGQDGFARTPISWQETDKSVTERIDTRVVNTWKQQVDASLVEDQASSLASEYIGPHGRLVFGLHQRLSLFGVNWALISEIDRAEALAEADKQGNIILIMVLLTSVLATYIAKSITQPVTTLAKIAESVSLGETEQRFDIRSNNEIGMLGVAFNKMLDARNKHERELEQSTQNTLKALKNLEEQKFALDQHAIVAVTDVQGNIVFVNKKFTEISGYSEEELIGQNHRILNSGYHDASFFRDMYRTIASGKVWHNEICNVTKNGEHYWVDTTIVPFMGDDAKPKSYIAIRTDITANKKAEAMMLEAKEMAEESTRLKSDFLANMSHEIRTPMNGIIGATGLLLDTRLDSKQRNFADTTMSSAEALLVLINDILDFSKIEAGKLELETIDFDMQLLAEEVSEILALKCREKNIEMLLRYVPDTPRYFKGDPGRIRQILLNLLSNAVKFTESGSVLLTVAVDEDYTGISQSSNLPECESVLRISVQDSGIGIAEDKLDAVFKQFEQADSSTTRHFGGTGLGLAICKQLAELMGGEVGVDSELGKGSTFWFTTKLQLSDKKLNEVVLDDYKQLAGLRCLLIDDNEIGRMIYSEQLAAYKVSVEALDSAVHAKQILLDAVASDNPFDFVISDYQMPELDGAALAQQIKAQPELANLPLVLLTSSPQKGDSQKMYELGFSGYLTKPTYSMELPKLLSAVWHAHIQSDDIGLVTRHTIQEASVKPVEKFILENAEILLVEDNAVNQMVATAILKTYGVNVSTALNGLEAVQMFEQNRYDLVFMDCQMPEMDGFEASRQIRLREQAGENTATPIVAFTANAMQGDREKCLEAGMDDFIAKPVKKTDIEHILLRYLAAKVRSGNVIEKDNDKAVND